MALEGKGRRGGDGEGARVKGKGMGKGEYMCKKIGNGEMGKGRGEEF